MEKILYLLILIVLFLYPTSTYASKEAGTSASLDSQNIQKKEIDTKEIDTFAKKSVQRMVIREVLHKYDSPLASEVDGFINACMQFDIDCYLLPSIAGLESTFGKYTYPNSYNPFGWGGGYIMFESWETGFVAVAEGLQKNYIQRGADTIETIAPIYAASPTWASRVRYLHNEFERVEAKKTAYFHELAAALE